MELFEKYTVPSVEAQTFKDFRWVILVDPSFKGLTHQHTKRLSQHGEVLPVDFFFTEQQPEIGELLDYKDEWVCSTRIDSDDIIRNDFMERVQGQATEEEAWIAFVNMLKGDRIAPRQFSCNPFISYVEYAQPFKSVYSISHMQVSAQPCAYKKLEIPGWIQVDHCDNIKNSVNKKLRNFELDSIEAAYVYEDFTWRRS
jgi:hypothetical protein